MSTKRILTSLILGLSLLLVLKIVFDRPDEVPSLPDAPQEADNRPAPELPVRYAIGNVDPRFDISVERYRELAQEAESIWNQASGKTLFIYDPEAPLKVNLVFDWRQEKLLAAKEARAKLDQGGSSFDELQADYDVRAREVDNLKSEFDAAAREYAAAAADYEVRVKRWNETTEHPDSELHELQSREKKLEEDRKPLEQKQSELNTRGEELNKFGEQLTARAKEFNLDVENFNGTFVTARDFEKGVYDGRAINIYEFEHESDLKLTLIHEFGHALGLGHIENPKAIMNRRLAAQDHEDIRLTQDDLNLLAEKIK